MCSSDLVPVGAVEELAEPGAEQKLVRVQVELSVENRLARDVHAAYSLGRSVRDVLVRHLQLPSCCPRAEPVAQSTAYGIPVQHLFLAGGGGPRARQTALQFAAMVHYPMFHVKKPDKILLLLDRMKYINICILRADFSPDRKSVV